MLPPPKRRGWIRYTPGIEEELARALAVEGFEVRPYAVDLAKWREYLARADYASLDYYDGGRQANFTEKALEHFVAFDLLDLKQGGVYLDIASDGSPTPEIYERLTGCESWRQDLSYPAGVHGRKIGGDAARLPLADGFADAIGLHCSFEHFEGDADTRFIREAGRVLKPGGRMAILPLYIFHEHGIQTDPAAWPGRRLPFAPEPGARIYCARRYNNRHGRFYDAAALAQRIRPVLGPLKLTILKLTNAEAIDPACYLRFIGVFEKPV